MGIALADGFSLRATKPLDDRLLFDTISDMAGYSETSVYDGCIAFNKENEKTYQFNTNNAVDTTFGKWREFSGSGSVASSEIDDNSISATKTYSSSKIESLIETEVDDSQSSTTTTYSSDKIDALLSNKAEINDASSSSTAVYSSAKVDSLLLDKTEIDDSTSGSTTTYSSAKIDSLLNTKAEINDSTSSTSEVYSSSKVDGLVSDKITQTLADTLYISVDKEASLSDKYTKAEIDAKIANISASGGSVDLADFKAEVNDSLDAISTAYKEADSTINTRLNTIEYGVKLNKTGAQEYLFATGGSVGQNVVVPVNGNALEYFDNISSNTSNISLDNGILTLKAGNTYKIEVGLLFDSNLDYYLVDSTFTGAITDISQKYGSSGFGGLTNYGSNQIEAVLSPETDLVLKLIQSRRANMDIDYSFLSVIILNPYAVDPIAYVEEQDNISDTPVGTVFEMLSTNVVPNGYLPTDGRTLNIGDYPYLEEYFKNAFGMVNYYGGDGETTYQLPEDIEETTYNTTMTSNNSNGLIASASSIATSSWDAFYAFNGTLTDGSGGVAWASENVYTYTDPQWLQLNFGSVTPVTHMRIYRRTNNANNTAKSFIIQGSNDGVTFYDILVCSDIDWEGNSYKLFDLDGVYMYSVYRLYDVQATGDESSGRKWASILEWQFIYKNVSKIIKAVPAHYFNLESQANNNYTTDEKIIGEFNGSILYQKSWFDVAISASTQISVADLNVNKMIYVDAMLDTDEFTIHNGYDDNNDYINLYYAKSTKSINVGKYQNSGSNPVLSHLTIKYTKN